MSNPTSNFNWQMPTNTDLVSQLPADFEVFGQAVDTSLADLKGGTSGQVLAKNSNTDMDFVWVAPDDSNAIQNAIVDAKGDLIAATAADTPARLAIGTNGQVLTADSAEATGMKWATSASGGWTLLASGNLSSNATTVNVTTTGYQQLVCINKDVSCTTDWYWKMRVNGDSGTNYAILDHYMSAGTTPAAAAYNATNGFFGENPNDLSDVDAYGVWTIYSPADTTSKKVCQGVFSSTNNSVTYRQIQTMSGQWYGTSGAITSVTFLPESTYSAGTYEIYGVK